MNVFQRSLQALCLALFLLLLLAADPVLTGFIDPARVFALDPAAYLGAVLTGRVLLPGLGALLFLLLLTWLLGRFFCGHVCPLGTTCDAVRPALGGKSANEPPGSRGPKAKYLALLFITAASLLGLNLAYWGAPLTLAGRLFILVLGPAGEFVLSGLSEMEVLSDQASSALGLPPDRYLGAWFFLLFFAALLGLQHFRSRFWCRFLCPAGAVFALVARRPIFRRTVLEACTDCGLCRKQCPMGAIGSDPRLTRHEECIVCQRCVELCPEGAIVFRGLGLREKFSDPEPFLPGRRAAVQTLATAAAVAFVSRAGLVEAWNRQEEGQRILSSELIRPPGALPEDDFLNRCIRCGLCLRICPTDMLQPAMGHSGWSGFQTPVAVARSGPCEPGCTLCGDVCPSGAIRRLPEAEKVWAKMGTAVVDRRKCLAWEWGERCLVCDEACSYGAVELIQEPGLEVAVPSVREDRCTGCGACEFACPVVDRPAIAVSSMAEIRLATGSYREEGERRGLDISRKGRESGEKQERREEREASGLPPGFQ
ncbi:MAG: 4Fe-4S binding protein [Desulfohalobiaceae bacterium]|nr:4Fe-4S binding protein [Desulfohalobiaceae bacterium]